MAAMISRDQLDLRQHAAQRMLERNISVADVLIALNSGATIEDYPDDTPFPSALVLGFVGAEPVHVVVARVLGRTGSKVSRGHRLNGRSSGRISRRGR